MGLCSVDARAHVHGSRTTSHRAQRNFDMKQSGEKIAAAAQVNGIFCKYPDKDRGSRKLSDTLGHWNPRSWPGDVSTKLFQIDALGQRRDLALRGCWTQGSQQAAFLLTCGSVLSAAEVNWQGLADQGHTMMAAC